MLQGGSSGTPWGRCWVRVFNNCFFQLFSKSIEKVAVAHTTNTFLYLFQIVPIMWSFSNPIFLNRTGNPQEDSDVRRVQEPAISVCELEIPFPGSPLLPSGIVLSLLLRRPTIIPPLFHRYIPPPLFLHPCSSTLVPPPNVPQVGGNES